MNPKLLLCLALALGFVLTGCTSTSNEPLDVRAALLASAKKDEADFPDGHKLLLTHFSHVGQLITSRGEIIFVADQRAVIADQMAPHGLNFIAFFDSHFRFLGKINYVKSRPLWCDGSKLYLFGDLDSRIPQYPPGNVIDLARGYKNLKVYHAKVYGSSGGFEDN
jgi:hypothetical protein